MHYTFTRNRTYNATDLRDRYRNIRLYHHQHVYAPDGDVPYVIPPGSGDGGWSFPNADVLDAFSASCWNTFQELTDHLLWGGQEAIPLGLGAS